MPTRETRPLRRTCSSWTRGAAAALMLAASAASAQQAGPKADPQMTAWSALLRDFIHYTLIDRPDVAASYAQQLMDANIPPRKFVDLLEMSGELARFENVMPRALQKPELEKFAAKLQDHYRRGRLERVRDPAEIKANIALLRGTARPQLQGREGLVAAGEYAVPQLLSALIQHEDPALSSSVGRLLTDMNRQAIAPLCAALPELDPASQTLVIEVLGRSRYRTAAPVLAELSKSTASAPVREACLRALDLLGGVPGDAADEYAVLAIGYYDERADLTSFPGEEHQLFWTYKPDTGLFATAIRTEVFHEAMAMQATERSLTLRPEGNETALVVWLASNFSREIDTPAEYDNPLYAASRRDAMYYAVAAGARPSQAVLARAIDDTDTRLARRAIAAIEKTAGGATLWTGLDDRRPLLEALRYPNRRVQYEAALAVGSAQPTAAFEGSDRVVPILASAIRDADDRFAVVVSTDNESYNVLRALLEKQGYTVLPRGATLAEVAQPIADAPGIDVIVAQLTTEPAAALVAEARASRGLLATPILALVPAQTSVELGRQLQSDPAVYVRSQGIGQDTIGAAVTDLVATASGGPITDEEARHYAGRCLGTLRDLAVSQNAVLAAGDAAPPLITALGSAAGATKLAIADVLSRINQKRAQVAVMDSALNASGSERIALLGLTADSAKRHGNLLEPRQVDRAVELAATGSDDEATAAAALVGSLNLPNTSIVPLILGKRD
ncbi:MAG: HEAT repeat domain-containing protein [Phycisphaerales bacterium]